MKRTFALLLALAMVFCLMVGCGGSDNEDTGSSKKGATETATVTVEPGKYLAVSCIGDGEEYPCDEDWLIIENGGSGTLVFEGTEYDMDWTFSGNAFSFEDEEGSTFTGTYADGVIEGILDSNLEYVFELEETAPAKKDETGAEPAADGDFTPVTGVVADCTVSIVGAELFTDADDKDAIRFYWDFTNETDEAINASWDIYSLVEQEGFEMGTTYTWDDVPEYNNAYQDVQPGVTIRCISEYSCKADGDIITFTLYNFYDEDETLVAEFDPANLPGRPAKDWVAEPITDPQWVAGLPSEGAIGDGYVVIDHAEIVPGWDDGEEVVRVYFQFSNNGEEASSMWMETYYAAYQDGIELELDWADEDVPEDELISEDVEPGDTVLCAETFVLRSENPIEIEVYGWDDDSIGAILYPADLR